MAAGRIVIEGYMPALDASGNPLSGATITFYENGTTDLATVYADYGLSTPLTNPVVANSAGQFASIFADDQELFSVKVETAAGSLLTQRDDVRSIGAPAGGGGSTAEIATLALAEASDLSGQAFVRLAGYDTAGDGGSALYKPVDEEPDHAGAFQSDDGQWWEIAENETWAEQFGAVGDGTTDDTTAILAAVAYRNAVGGVVRFQAKTYLIKDTLELTNCVLKGAGTQRTSPAVYTKLLFAALVAQDAVRVDDSARAVCGVEDLEVWANSWDGTTGCTGYGLNISSRVIVRNAVAAKFKKSGLFLHQASDGGMAPYESLFENFSSLYSGEHGTVVGTGANTVTFINYQGKWNGAPSYGVAPSVAGNYDGLIAIRDGAGGSGTYGSYVPENLRIIGGDCSYNSRYGWNFDQVQNSIMHPGYAEGNLGSSQVQHGADFIGCQVFYSAVAGGSAAVGLGGVYYEYIPKNQIWIGGILLGGGGALPLSAYSWLNATANPVFFADPLQDNIVYMYREPDDSAVHLKGFGPDAKWRLGDETQYIEVGNGSVKMPAEFEQAAINFGQAASIPGAPPTDTARPHIYYNTSPAPAGFVGWVWCVGTAAWKGFGVIAA